MITQELLRKIKHIEIYTSRLVENTFGGQYESTFKGRGMEFAEVREYYHGDDIRMIDWNVTARMGTPYVKVFQEERELTVLFVVDVSSSLHFGSNAKLKSEVAAEICAVLAFSAIMNNDRVGLVQFSDHIENFIPIKKGKRHVLRLIREILYYKPTSKQRKPTDLQSCLQSLNTMLNKKTIIFVISDFIADNYDTPLKILARTHDVIGIHLFDPRELEIPPIGYVYLEDLEKGTISVLNTNKKNSRDRFQKNADEAFNAINARFKSLGIDKITIDVTQSFIDPLVVFFKNRRKRI